MRMGRWGMRQPLAHRCASRAATLVSVLLALVIWSVSACGPVGGAGQASTRATSMLAVPPAAPSPAVAPAAALAALPAPPSASGTEVYLMNPDTGGVYVATNASTPQAMASTTKIMTALVAVSYGRLDQRITVGADAMLPKTDNASVAGLKQGEVFTLSELLYALLLPSGDDAAIAIADGVAGSQANFVLLMNSEAQMLGLRHTHYANVHGLDAPGQYSSAVDLARLTVRALEEPILATVVETPVMVLPASSDHPKLTLRNTNVLLFPPAYQGIIGVKTGFTGKAGYCLVFAAQRPEGRLIGVVLGEPKDGSRFADARALLNWGFALEGRIETMSHFAAQPPN